MSNKTSNQTTILPLIINDPHAHLYNKTLPNYHQLTNNNPSNQINISTLETSIETAIEHIKQLMADLNINRAVMISIRD